MALTAARASARFSVKVMAGGLKRILLRLRHEWTKNDGKPWEEWAPRHDLKEMVLLGALAICTGALVVATTLLVFK